MIKIAIDVGTTNIDMAFFDSDKNEVIFEKGFHNRQSLYGSDVINRINTVKRDKSFIGKLKALALEDISNAIDEFKDKYEYNYSDIDAFCLSGNTTMISILLEYDISDMGENPYPTILKKSFSVNSEDIFGEDCKFDCEVLLTGCVSAFIGGDILSGLVFLDEDKNAFLDDSSVNLLIDLGTNGEMVLNNKGKLLAASAACGPAFEASLKRQGVYGASAVDAVSLLISSGKLSENGSLKDEYIENGVSIKNLYKKACINYEDTDKVYISGGFGSYLNIDSAIKLGIIPKAFKDKTVMSGNTSLKGALEILKNKDLIKKADSLREETEVLILADEEGYNESLINNMFYKEF